MIVTAYEWYEKINIGEIKMILDSILTCPECAYKMKEIMLENTSQYSYRCPSCEKQIKTKQGECCVFCCYGDYPCPQEQVSASSCCGRD